ncbi:reverse transcriptase domain-containing protein [Tanacetum coccineum]
MSATTPLIGFSGKIIWPIGKIQLLVKIGDEEHFASAWMNFVVVRSPSSYNEIIGRPRVRKLQAVPSTAHGMLKIPVKGGVITLKSSKLVQLECAMVSGPEGTPSATKPIMEERVKRNLDIFAWKPVDMTGVPRHIAEHRLNVREGCSPVRQKKRGQAADRNQAIQEEVGKLMEKSNFHWTAKAEEAFKQMKQLIAELPMLTALMEKEELIVYLAAAKETILADFIVERPEEDSPDTLMEVEEELLEPWILFTDGSSCTDGSGAGLILTNPEGMEFTYALRFRFDATNNEAKYEALIFGLRIAEQMGVKNLQANVDSRLVVNQVNGMYVAKEADMIRYLEKVRTLTNSFKAFSIRQVPRKLKEKSISEVEILVVMEEVGDTWMTLIFNYLEKGTLPADVKKARAVRRKSWQFSVIDGTLYKKSFLGPWLRFGLPGEIISDNGKQFRDDPFKDWCKKLCIRQHFASVKHSQTNGLVERANHSLGEGIKARLDARSNNWMEEIPHAVIPAEIGMPILKTAEKALEINLDLLEERREESTIREAKSKSKMEKYYNSKVRNTSFKPGDLVYRNNDASRAEDTGKLGPKWEGSYEVTEALGKGAYKLRDRDGKQLSQTWNISNLKKCYIYKM